MKKILFLIGIMICCASQSSRVTPSAMPLSFVGDWQEIYCQSYSGAAAFGRSVLHFNTGGRVETDMYTFEHPSCHEETKSLARRSEGYYEVLNYQSSEQNTVYEMNLHTPLQNVLQKKILILNADELLLCNQKDSRAGCKQFRKIRA